MEVSKSVENAQALSAPITRFPSFIDTGCDRHTILNILRMTLFVNWYKVQLKGYMSLYLHIQLYLQNKYSDYVELNVKFRDIFSTIQTHFKQDRDLFEILLRISFFTEHVYRSNMSKAKT